MPANREVTSDRVVPMLKERIRWKAAVRSLRKADQIDHAALFNNQQSDAAADLSLVRNFDEPSVSVVGNIVR